VLMPFFLRLFLGLKPLPPGPLRERLENTARRLGFRYSNILVWNSRKLIATAIVTGFTRWMRYVILTDGLIDHLAPDEIEAVFGHEIEHIKHHHLIFYLAFFLTSFILIGIAWASLADAFDVKALSPWIPIPDKDELILIGNLTKAGLMAGY